MNVSLPIVNVSSTSISEMLCATPSTAVTSSSVPVAVIVWSPIVTALVVSLVESMCAVPSKSVEPSAVVAIVSAPVVGT